jgi:pimeloyl-ACP methyl ester carboxylesterase
MKTHPAAASSFRHQMQGRLANEYRLIAFDLPGHGQSSNGTDFKRSYTRPGFTDAAVEVLGQLGVTKAVVLDGRSVAI